MGFRMTTIISKAPALPGGAVRGCSYRGGVGFPPPEANFGPRYVWAKIRILWGIASGASGLSPPQAENFFENDAFKEKIY